MCRLLAIALSLLPMLAGPLDGAAAERTHPGERMISVAVPSLVSDNPTLNRAFRIALGDLLGNIQPYQNGLLQEPANVILAGVDYGTPWTRDAAINSWNGASLLLADVARDTLLSVLQRTPSGVQIGGQYWDAIVWTTGAWHHYLYTGDQKFLHTALTATANTLKHREQNEFDAEIGLFRGPGWSDGVAGYPDRYTNPNGHSCILEWPKTHPKKAVKRGYGIPMMALSTNCLYFNAYRTASKMARELNEPVDPTWSLKAESLKVAINRHLWNPDRGDYRFFVDPWGGCDYQEGLGHAYALLFGVAEGDRVEAVIKNLHVTPAGLPCEWPSYPRYDSEDGLAVARHAGTVWPQIQAFWAEAMARQGRNDAFAHELFCLAKHAERDNQFAEIYHPMTGEIYGGMQEKGPEGIGVWKATSRQTWAATGFLRMILIGLAGLRFDTDGVSFEPCMPFGPSRPSQVTHLELKNIRYRDMTIDLVVHGHGNARKECRVNGHIVTTPFLAANLKGRQVVQITLAP